jgi:hypothetical protein
VAQLSIEMNIMMKMERRRIKDHWDKYFKKKSTCRNMMLSCLKNRSSNRRLGKKRYLMEESRRISVD